MSVAPHDVLIQKIRSFTPRQPGSVGMGLDDFKDVPLTEDLLRAILDCLKSADKIDRRFGLFACEGVLTRRGLNALGPELRETLLGQLPASQGDEDPSNREQSIRLLIELRDLFPGYRDLMLRHLKASDSFVKLYALSVYETFLTKKDVPILLNLQWDEYYMEEGMGSPVHRYVVRNKALEVIEKLCGRHFRTNELFVTLDSGHMAYWRDWEPFLQWWQRRTKRWWMQRWRS
jgi:hypothetical protein